MLEQKVNIEREEYLDCHSVGYSYRLSFEDSNRPNGIAHVWLREFGHHDLSLLRQYREEGMSIGDYAIEIYNFFPTSGSMNRRYIEYERRGVGSSLLRKIIQDTLDLQVKFIIVIANAPNNRTYISAFACQKSKVFLSMLRNVSHF